MQTIKFISLFLIGLTLFSCSRSEKSTSSVDYSNPQHQLPRVLIITTGLESSKTTLPKGIVIALQSFNQKGATVRLEPRDILYQPRELKKFNVIILSTARGYHDADRKYSLTFMSKAEMENLRKFVHSGGILISGDNVGRNKTDGTDRIVLHGKLAAANYPLAECYGLELTEKNMEGFQVYGHLSGETSQYMRSKAGKYFYTLVPDRLISDHVEILANWVNKTDTIPAIVKNHYGNGTAYLLASSDFLHPADEGGLLSTNKISGFYHAVLEDFHSKNNIPLQLNPWPGGHQYAFCVTMNAGGKLKNYKHVQKVLKKYKITADYFVNGNVPEDIRHFLQKESIHLQSNGYAFDNYRNFNYSQSVSDILKNEQVWEQDFIGFRFPYTMPGFWGMMALSEQNYTFESSIGANNLKFIHGSVVPHNIVVGNEGFYHSTDIIELAPTYHDDYYFLKNVETLRKQSPRKLFAKTQLYDKYLENYWNYAVKPYGGVMVYQGHPGYVGNNDTTITALGNLFKMVKNDDTWIASAYEISSFRKNLMMLRFYVKSSNNKIVVFVAGSENVEVDDVCLNLDFEPIKVNASVGKAIIQKDSLQNQVVFKAVRGQTITIRK
ncbi:MAG: beta-galactosidase trimerization domain-containing protein [Salinivirgaceae bacterium]|nr:beta-galactosidase trimerization domain-containing protein [Salinivirgaceae bacterium]